MKPEKTTPNKRLKSYSALAASLIAVGGAADAQIVYTNVTDYVGIFNGDSYPLDLNNDGNTDFNVNMSKYTFTSSYYGGSYSFRTISAKASTNNKISRATSSSYYAAALALNATIDSNNNWGYGSNANMAGGFGSFAFGAWVGQQDMYLGLELTVNSNTYYGWARLSVSQAADTFFFKDYAYQLTKKKQILAGDKGITTSIDPTDAPVSSVYASEKMIYVNLEEANNSSISITNVLGEEVRSLVAEDKNSRIDMSAFPTGIYFVTVRRDNAVTTSKVYL